MQGHKKIPRMDGKKTRKEELIAQIPGKISDIHNNKTKSYAILQDAKDQMLEIHEYCTIQHVFLNNTS